MDTLTVLFPADEAGAAPIAEFADDFKAADLFPVFEPLLFDLNRAINSRELVLYGTRRDQHAPMMYRGPRLQAEQYRKLYQLVEGRHWRMITDHYVYEFDHYHRNAPYVHVVNEPYLAIPEMAMAGSLSMRLIGNSLMDSPLRILTRSHRDSWSESVRR